MSCLISLVLCSVLSTILAKELIFAHPELKYLFWPSLIFIWLAVIPVFISLYLFYLMSHEIIKDNPFYIKNISRLTIVSRLALVEDSFYLFQLNMLIIIIVFQVSLLLIIIIFMFIALAMLLIIAILVHIIYK